MGMTLKKTIFAAISGILIFLLLTSCAKNPPAEDGKGKIKVTWMVAVNWLRPATEKLVAEFEKRNPDIKVELIWVPQMHYQTKMKTLAAAGQCPDLIYTGDVWVAYMLPFLTDLTDLVERDAKEIDLDDFYPQVLEACRHDGRYYFLSNGMTISMLYYNRKIFDEAGVKYPTTEWTWEDFISAGQKLTKKGPDGKVDIWGCDSVTGWWGEWLIYVRQSGGALFNKELTKCLIDSPESVRGLKMYYDKIYKYKFSPGPGRGPSNGFAGGQMAMLYGGHVNSWKNYNALGLDWDVQILPKGPAGRKGGEIAMDAYGISKTCKQKEAAWKLLKFLAAKENISEVVKRGALSVRKSVAEELLLSKSHTDRPHNIAAVYEAIKYAEPIPRSPDIIEISIDIIQPEIDRMILGDLTPEEAAKRATESANRFIKVVGRRK